ncbi:MAG TPA: hypothetical protein PK450_09545 [Paracoccaceae bacterium]|nr:hypothetical protein [Paracoccaceae bacterium]
MERFLNGLLGGLVRDLVNRAVNWGFDRAARRDDGQIGPDAAPEPDGKDQPMTADLAEKARQMERMMRRLGR